MPFDDTYINRWDAGVDAAYKALEKQFMSGKPDAPTLYTPESGRPLIGVDDVIDLALLVAAVLKAADAVKGH